MTKPLRSFTPQDKARVALAAIRGEQTTVQISSDFNAHPTQVGLWKKYAVENLSELFVDKQKQKKQTESQSQEKMDYLYKIIGQKDAELDWLKKKLSTIH